MCGPGKAEEQLGQSEQTFANTLQQNYNTQFANRSDVLGRLNSTLSPIVAAGPNQQGFSPGESAAINSNILNTTGANYANAARSVQNSLAGRGGGSANTNVQSGTDQQVRAALASSAAGTTSNEENQAVQANYNQGRQNFSNALSGEEGVASLYNPNGTGQLANSANNQAFSQANTIQTQKSQLLKDIAGAGIAAGSSILTGGFGGFGAGSRSGPAMAPGIGGDPSSALDPNVMAQLGEQDGE